ncbi:WYL domain-containing protein [Phaeobacter italicus]|uniref:WYL domain-containing protein n=1 Tax=Phaeobacter italicus TaxID=481446 RepID=UPI002FDB2FC0
MLWKIVLAPIALPIIAIRAITKNRRQDEPWKAAQERMAAGKGDAPPENPKYATWYDALNRPVTDDLLFEIEYQDRDGAVTTRTITPKIIHLAYDLLYIEAHCKTRQDTRTFRSDQILSCRNLTTNRKVADLGDYLRRKY